MATEKTKTDAQTRVFASDGDSQGATSAQTAARQGTGATDGGAQRCLKF